MKSTKKQYRWICWLIRFLLTIIFNRGDHLRFEKQLRIRLKVRVGIIALWFIRRIFRCRICFRWSLRGCRWCSSRISTIRSHWSSSRIATIRCYCSIFGRGLIRSYTDCTLLNCRLSGPFRMGKLPFHPGGSGFLSYQLNLTSIPRGMVEFLKCCKQMNKQKYMAFNHYYKEPQQIAIYYLFFEEKLKYRSSYTKYN